MRTLYFDCYAGASGNMIIGALLDLGVSLEELESGLAKLGLDGWELEVTRVDRSGIASTHVEVRVPEEHGHRHLRHIREILDRSALSHEVKRRALEIFTNLAAAEAKVHGIDIERVHFHEVGAVDAIIDVVGACIGFELLGIEAFACSRMHVGSGFVKMEHGKFPVPPPAVAELLKGKPVYSTEIEGELLTPTGAAIISTVCDSYGALPDMRVEHMGYGAGTREYKDFPNTLRLMLGETSRATASNESGLEIEDLLLLETNVDDLPPQALGYFLDRAFEAGALDCWFTPIQMKKNRPAVMVSVLCAADTRAAISELMYSETTTLGIRVKRVERESLSRKFDRVETPYGPIGIKLATFRGRIVNMMPEYDDVAAAALEHGVPFMTVREAALLAAGRNMSAAA